MRQGLVAAAALVAALLLAAPAPAEIVLFFSRQTAAPGVRVGVYTGRPGRHPSALFKRAPAGPLGIVVYLVPLSALRYPYGPYPAPLPAWIRVAELSRDGKGVGRARFRVPALPAGAYTTGVWCGTCKRRSAFIGGDLLGSPADARASVLRVR